MSNFIKSLTAGMVAVSMTASVAFAAAHAGAMVMGSDQDVSGGKVTAEKVVSPADGWLVIHTTEDGMKPGPVIGHAALKAGENLNVVTDLEAPVASGAKLMLMLHGEEGGMKAGEFEYYLGAKEDGPIKIDDKLVMSVITAK